MWQSRPLFLGISAKSHLQIHPMSRSSTRDPRKDPLLDCPDKLATLAHVMPEKASSGAVGSPRGAAIWFNLIAAVLMATLIGGGAFVSSRVLIIDDRPNQEPGRHHQFVWGTFIPAQPWNIGVTLIGTVIGIIASLAFSAQDDFMTRRALASDYGCPAMFLRPLTAKRGVQQLFRGMLSPERTLLFLLTATTAIMSATTIAVFSIQQNIITVLNPQASYLLKDFNTTFFQQGIGFFSPAGSFGTGTGALGQFMYKSAYINALIDKDSYNRQFRSTGSPDFEWIAEGGQLGFTNYPNMSTGGVGLNVASYAHRSGDPVTFALPASSRYRLDSLQGDVYGTRIQVTCEDATDDHTVARGSSEDVETRFVSRSAGPNITIMWDGDFGKTYRSLAIGSSIWGIEDEESHPTLTLAFGGSGGYVWVAECTYAGYEYLTGLTLDSTDSYIQSGLEEKARFSDIGPVFKQEVANATGRVIEQGMGGQLARGFINAQYFYDGITEPTSDLTSVLSTVLSQVGEAYVSLLRQQNYEYTGAWSEDSVLQADNNSFMNVRISVLRLGGASYGWLAVYGVIFLGCLLGLVRASSRAEAVTFEAQDAVKLLANVHDPSVKGRTRLRYDEALTIVGL
ncbi:hypothetical protein HJFPF1_08342 [Paramyrothecium foliicola]|nr:hypothetical protein HJFPF1_08342 [Paramyrothecium foliicola]